MSLPAGVLIRRWFAAMVGLLLAVNGVALVSSVVIARSVRVVVTQTEPIALASAAVRQEILGAQKELFRYLAEFSDDTSRALAALDRLRDHLAEARAVATAPEVATELAAIEKNAEQYRKVLEILPDTSQGSRDWNRLQEYSATAVSLGTEVEESASRLVAAAQEEIRERAGAALRAASWARWGAVATLAASLLVVFALHHWWRRFQELVLGI